MKKRREDEIEREIRTHLVLEAEDAVANGMSETEARYAALRTFGNVTRTQDDVRAVWRRRWPDEIVQDSRYAFRALRKSPTFTIVAVLTLALGIGANTAVFSVLNAIALRTPLHVPNPDQLVTVNGGGYIDTGPDAARFSGPVFELFKRSAPDTVGVAAMSRAIARVYTRIDGERETVPANLQLVSTNFFSVLGLAPSLGTTFPAQTLKANETEQPLAVLSYPYWQRRFSGSPSVVDRTLTINNVTFNIVGVAPREFTGVWLETPTDIWIPLAQQSAIRYSQSFSASNAALSKPWLPQPQIRWLYVVVRAPGQQTASVTSALSASIANLPAPDNRIILESFSRGFSRIRQQVSTPLIAILVMASFVLLIACANCANVLLARAAGRRREIAVRIAIGADRARIFRQLLTESALLVSLATIAAILFAQWAGQLLVRLAVASADPSSVGAPLDWRVFAFATCVAFLSVMVVGVWPAWRETRVDATAALKSSARGALGRAARPARLLVMAQVALSLALVCGTGLFVRGFRNLLDVALGFESTHLLTITIEPRLSGRPPHELPAMYARVLEAVAGVPGVESSALAMCGLQGSCSRDSGFAIEGYRPQENETVLVSVNIVSPSYFTTLRLRLLAGRVLEESDRTSTMKVAVVNKTLATRYFGEWRSAVGRRLGSGTLDTEIVGVVDDMRALGNLKTDTLPSMFAPLPEVGIVPREIEVRTSIDPAAALAPVRRAITTAAPELPIESIDAVTARIDRGLSQDRLLIYLTSGFSLLAIGLAGLGLFGVLSYAVVQRTPELGLRLALGASQSSVLWSVVRDALWLLIGGMVLGLPLAVLGMKLIAALAFEVSPYDATSAVSALVVLLVIGTTCAIVPALRAARVDPVIALRSE